MRRKSKKVMCGDVAIGGGAPISIQSMTNTDTRDVRATVNQIAELTESGCQIIRCAVPDMEAAEGLGRIKKAVRIPVVADIHFDYRLALEAMKQGADKIRINPGNIGSPDRVKAVLGEAKVRGIPIRVGVNAGSLEKDLLEKYGGVTAEGLAESALRTVDQVEEMDFHNLVVSVKASDIKLNHEVHRLIADRTEHPLHIGITESGTVSSGRVKSSIGIGALLLLGIGDTLRVSLTGDPIEEVLLAREILKSLGLVENCIQFVSCPTCGRTRVDLSSIASEIEKRLRPLEEIMRKNNVPGLTVAVMGCEVNGPGEASHADLGVACGKGRGVLFQKGRILRTVPEAEIADELIALLKQKVENNNNIC